MRPISVASEALERQLRNAIDNAHRELGDVSQEGNPHHESPTSTTSAPDPRLPSLVAVLVARLQSQWKLSAGESLTRALIAARPTSAIAWRTLGTVLLSTGRNSEAVRAFERGYSLEATSENHSDLLLALQYADNATPEQLLAAHREWHLAHAENLSPPAVAAAADKRGRRRLRVGFLSRSFARSPIGFLGLPAIEALDREQCAVFCYSDGIRNDEYTARFQACANGWRNCLWTSQPELAEIIRQDEIDVLVDLDGHTSARLLTFARRPAPLQISWLGYVGTTGLGAMDYLVADRFHVMPGEEAFYTEKIMRLPNGYACYQAPDDAPAVATLPALNQEYITFGCFNNPAKMSPSILKAWHEILRRVPRSQLFFKYGGLQESPTQDYLRSQLCSRDVVSGRVRFEGWSSHRDLLDAYNRVDVALDTQPYSGGLTTCEAMWMGVPVVTYPGRTFAGRHSTSHLTNAGYGQFVAKDVDEYVQMAVDWAGRLDELAALRLTMRSAVDASLLCNAPFFAHHFLKVIQEAWLRCG